MAPTPSWEEVMGAGVELVLPCFPKASRSERAERPEGRRPRLLDTLHPVQCLLPSCAVSCPLVFAL